MNNSVVEYGKYWTGKPHELMVLSKFYEMYREEPVSTYMPAAWSELDAFFEENDFGSVIEDILHYRQPETDSYYNVTPEFVAMYCAVYNFEKAQAEEKANAMIDIQLEYFSNRDIDKFPGVLDKEVIVVEISDYLISKIEQMIAYERPRFSKIVRDYYGQQRVYFDHEVEMDEDGDEYIVVDGNQAYYLSEEERAGSVEEQIIEILPSMLEYFGNYIDVMVENSAMISGLALKEGKRIIVGAQTDLFSKPVFCKIEDGYDY